MLNRILRPLIRRSNASRVLFRRAQSTALEKEAQFTMEEHARETQHRKMCRIMTVTFLPIAFAVIYYYFVMDFFKSPVMTEKHLQQVAITDIEPEVTDDDDE